MGSLLEAALRYAELGYPVFPCAPGTKRPLTENGFHDAVTDPDQIERWWTERPNANNHWLDCLVGCAVAGSIQGVTLFGTEAKSVVKRSRVKLSDLKRERK